MSKVSPAMSIIRGSVESNPVPIVVQGMYKSLIFDYLFFGVIT